MKTKPTHARLLMFQYIDKNAVQGFTASELAAASGASRACTGRFIKKLEEWQVLSRIDCRPTPYYRKSAEPATEEGKAFLDELNRLSCISQNG